MLQEMKKDFFQLISSLGYNVTDNGNYVEDFPWIMVRTNGNKVAKAANSELSTITLTLDVYSSYSGEKEIIEIIENITNHLEDLYENPLVLFGIQKNLKILDDKGTGPVRKHGIAVYEFLTGYGLEDIPKAGEDDAKKN